MEQIGRLVIFDDITERSELERRLVQADKLTSIGLLAAGVAHEVNTPLAVISTYAQMLAKQVADDEQKSRMLDKIAKQTFRASEIVNSLLNFSRTSSTEVAQVNLNRVIQETLSLLEHPLQDGRHSRGDAAWTRPCADRWQFRQAAAGVHEPDHQRSRRHGAGRRCWKSSTEQRRSHVVRVDVADTGHGIAPEHLPRIYDPFFTTKAARKGTGLGLSVTYGIVQEHGGTIEVFPNPGGGSRFRIELPASQEVIARPELRPRAESGGRAVGD